MMTYDDRSQEELADQRGYEAAVRDQGALDPQDVDAALKKVEKYLDAWAIVGRTFIEIDVMKRQLAQARRELGLGE